jgi:hypothetical protein
MTTFINEHFGRIPQNENRANSVDSHFRGPGTVFSEFQTFGAIFFRREKKN